MVFVLCGIMNPVELQAQDADNLGLPSPETQEFLVALIVSIAAGLIVYCIVDDDHCDSTQRQAAVAFKEVCEETGEDYVYRGGGQYTELSLHCVWSGGYTVGFYWSGG